MQYILGGLAFPRERRCLCCNALFTAYQLHDKHCSPVCLHSWNERTLSLHQNFVRKTQALPTSPA